MSKVRVVDFPSNTSGITGGVGAPRSTLGMGLFSIPGD